MQPPRPTAIAHGKLSSHVCPKSAEPERHPFSRKASSFQPVQTTTRSGSTSACACQCRISLVAPLTEPALDLAARHGNPAQRNFDTTLPLSVKLRTGIRQSLGKHRQHAHRRRFARPPRFKNRAGLTIVGAASKLEIHDAWPLAMYLIQRRSAQLLFTRPMAPAGLAWDESKFLNHRAKSRTQMALSQMATCCKKIFTNPSSKSLESVFSKRFIPLWG
jgi:hypothetical protein